MYNTTNQHRLAYRAIVKSWLEGIEPMFDKTGSEPITNGTVVGKFTLLDEREVSLTLEDITDKDYRVVSKGFEILGLPELNKKVKRGRDIHDVVDADITAITKGVSVLSVIELATLSMHDNLRLQDVKVMGVDGRLMLICPGRGLPVDVSYPDDAQFLELEEGLLEGRKALGNLVMQQALEELPSVLETTLLAPIKGIPHNTPYSKEIISLVVAQHMTYRLQLDVSGGTVAISFQLGVPLSEERYLLPRSYELRAKWVLELVEHIRAELKAQEIDEQALVELAKRYEGIRNDIGTFGVSENSDECVVSVYNENMPYHTNTTFELLKDKSE
ncbi:hypothetical protein [Vibrio phage phiKT1019]|nr:hypothetical protein [Vibrio phage phiKT1019]